MCSTEVRLVAWGAAATEKSLAAEMQLTEDIAAAIFVVLQKTIRTQICQNRGENERTTQWEESSIWAEIATNCVPIYKSETAPLHALVEFQWTLQSSSIVWWWMNEPLNPSSTSYYVKLSWHNPSCRCCGGTFVDILRKFWLGRCEWSKAECSASSTQFAERPILSSHHHFVAESHSCSPSVSLATFTHFFPFSTGKIDRGAGTFPRHSCLDLRHLEGLVQASTVAPADLFVGSQTFLSQWSQSLIRFRRWIESCPTLYIHPQCTSSTILNKDQAQQTYRHRHSHTAPVNRLCWILLSYSTISIVACL